MDMAVSTEIREPIDVDTVRARETCRKAGTSLGSNSCYISRLVASDCRRARTVYRQIYMYQSGLRGRRRGNRRGKWRRRMEEAVDEQPQADDDQKPADADRFAFRTHK